MLKKDIKEKIIKRHRRHDKDTGSSAVQAAVLDARIQELTTHLHKNKKDQHSRRGLLKLVAKRRTHQKYLARRPKRS